MPKAFLATAILPVVLLCTAGCGARHEYRADRLVMEREGWDSLFVNVSFLRGTVIGDAVAVEPDRVEVSLFDEGYETLYSGTAGVIPVPDRRLGNRERLTVEACGIIRSRQICLQDAIRASPKRLSVDEEIDFPLGSAMTEGRFDFTFRAERQVYGSEEWEAIEPVGVKGHLLAWVEGAESRRDGTVRVPFTSERGRFDLTRLANYRNFRYFLESDMLDDQTADVHFEIYAGLGDRAERLASVRMEVSRKSEGEREEDVRYFVEQATERLIDELGSFLGGRRAVAYVDDWEYDRLSNSYRVQMQAEWEGPFFNRRELAIEGVLTVREDGSDATFQLRSGNRRARNRWRDRVDGDVLALGTLDVRRPNRRTVAY